MMTKKQFTGYLQKLNSKLSGDPNHKIARAAHRFQSTYSHALLCGSGALILSGTLPYRPMHDIDFVMSERYFRNSGLWYKTDEYTHWNGPSDPVYTSYLYENRIEGQCINLLVYDDKEIQFNSETICSFDLTQGLEIKCQSIEDIISWKQKYNRSKDKEDLRIIMDKAFDDAVFTEEK